MQQIEPTTERNATDRMRVEAVAETLASLRGEGESLEEVAHEARNMVSALGLYCDLLEEPGVLAAPFSHYGNELRMVATASRRLVQKLVTLKGGAYPEARAADVTRGNSISLPWMEPAPEQQPAAARADLTLATQINDLAAYLRGCQNLLAALAGPVIKVAVETRGGALPVRMTGEDVTRILVNLVKNAAEAMTAGGNIRVSLWESPTEPDATPWLTLTIEDNGPGIPQAVLERIFEPGFTTRSSVSGTPNHLSWPAAHRGLGLSITSAIVEAAGGRIRVANRDPSGACFQIELPARSR